MATIWEVLRNVIDEPDICATEIFEYFKKNNYSRMNCEEFVNCLLRVSTTSPWTDYLFPGYLINDSGELFQYEVRASGSWSEKLNLGQEYVYDGLITELDFMFVVGCIGRGSPLSLEHTSASRQTIPNCDEGFSRVILNVPTSEMNKSFIHFLCEQDNGNYFLSPSKMVNEVEKIIRQMFINAEIQKHDPLENQNRPVTTLRFRNFPRLEAPLKTDRDLMFDIAPVLKTDIRLDDNLGLLFLSEYERSRVRSQPVLLVAKCCSDPLQWRISTSLAEREIFRRLVFNKAVAAVLKKAKLVKLVLFGQTKSIKSYFLKTTLLHWINQFKTPDEISNWSEDATELIRHVHELFQRFCMFLESGFLPHFFIRKINLLSIIDKNSSEIENVCKQIKEKDFKIQISNLLLTFNTQLYIADDHECDFEKIEDSEFTNEKVIVEQNLLIDDISTSLWDNDKQAQNFLLHQLNIIKSGGNDTVPNDVVSNDDLNLSVMLTLKYDNIDALECLLSVVKIRNIISGCLPAFHLASQIGNTNAVALFINHGIDINGTYNYSTPLLRSVRQNHLAVAEQLLFAGADVNTNVFGTKNNLETCNIRIKRLFISLMRKLGASEIKFDSVNFSCLHTACYLCDVKMADLLLKNNANVNASQMSSSSDLMLTPLSAAIMGINQCTANREEGNKLVKMLIDCGAKVNGDSENDHPLIIAAENNCLTTIDLLLGYGANVNWSRPNGSTALLEAAARGHEKIAKLLLKHGADMELQSEVGFTPLMAAVVEGKANIVRLLALNGANFHHVNRAGHMSLSLAVHQNYDEIVLTLITSGASVNKLDDDKHSSLHWASIDDNYYLAETLINHGADVNLCENQSPLHCAASHGSKSVAELLIKNGADVDRLCVKGTTPLFLAIEKNQSVVAELLIKFGADVNFIRRADETSNLHLACMLGRVQIARLLIDYNANVNLERNGDGSCLMLAVVNGRADVVCMLLDTCAGDNNEFRQKIDVNCFSKSGLTPLIAAVGKKDYAITRMLLEKGANANLLSPFSQGMSALSLASMNGLEDMVKTLLAFNANIEHCNSEQEKTPVVLAALENHLEIVRILANHGADMNVSFISEDEMVTPLIFAIKEDEWDLIETLLECGASLNAVDAQYQRSPLIYATINENIEIVRLLLAYAPNEQNYVNLADYHGSTALTIAAEFGYTDIVELLLMAGAKINVQDDDGDSALHVAAFKGHSEIVTLLLQHGASVNLRNNNGLTPIQ